MRHLFVVLAVLVALPFAAGANSGPLQTKLDKALDLVRSTPGFEGTAKRLDGLRGKGEIKIAKLEGALAMVQSSDTVYVTKKLLRTKGVKFIASTLVHEAVHLDQDDSRYYSVEEIEFKAYKMGGRFKLKVGMEPATIEKAAMRLTRNRFVREANTILGGYSGHEFRKKALTFDRETLRISDLKKLRELARINKIKNASKMTKKQLVAALTDRLNAGGLEKQSKRNLQILAKQQRLRGYSKMNKSQLVKVLTLRLDAHRMGVYSYKDLRLMAASRGIDVKPLRSKKSMVKALLDHDKGKRKARRPTARRASRTRHRVTRARPKVRARARAR